RQLRAGSAGLEPGCPGGRRGGDQCGLLGGGELELFLGSFEHEFEQAGQGCFGLLEHAPRGRAAVVEITGHADCLRVLAREQRREAHERPQVSTVAAQVRPAPKETSSTLSPLPILPSSTAWHRASGIDAVELLPYSPTVTTTRSGGS